MRKMLISLSLLLLFGCAGTQKQNNLGPQTTQDKQKKSLREYFQEFYKTNPPGKSEGWKIARKKILQMGDLGSNALCYFMVKFFYAGKNQSRLKSRGQDLGEYWLAAQRELILLGRKAVPIVVAAMGHAKLGTTGQEQCSRVLAKIGSPSIPFLVKNLKERFLKKDRNNQKFCRRILDTLAVIGDKKVAPHIGQIYLKTPVAKDEGEDEFYGLRAYCIKALGALRGKEELAVLEKALNDPNIYVRRKAIEAISKYDCPEALPFLQKAYQKASLSGIEFIKYKRRIARRMREIKNR